MGRHVSNSTWWLLLTSAHSRFHPTCISFDLISVFSSSPFTSAPPKHHFRRIQFVYLWLRSESIKKRRRCKHFALLCSHKAVVKNRQRTICFVEVTACNKHKCDNYVLKIHVALWLFHVPTGSYLFRVNTPETSLFQSIPSKMMQKWQEGGFGLFEYELFFFPLCTCQICGH